MARVFELPVCAVSSVVVFRPRGVVPIARSGVAYRAGTARSTTSFRPFENRHLGAHPPVSLAPSIVSVLPNAGLPPEGRREREKECSPSTISDSVPRVRLASLPTTSVVSRAKSMSPSPETSAAAGSMKGSLEARVGDGGVAWSVITYSECSGLSML